MKVLFQNSHAKAQRREEIQISKLQFLFASLRLCVIFFLLSFSVAAAKAQTNTLSDAEIKGRELAQQLCEAKPETNFVQTGVLNIRDSNGKKTSIPVSFKTQISDASWKAGYFAGTNIWIIIHQVGQKNRYIFTEQNSDVNAWNSTSFLHLTGDQTSTAFANSDFWLCDLGLEFLHWPAQKVLPKTTNLKRGRAYTLLESTNPNPSTNSYLRVRSWIDKETGGILQAEAYDAQGRLLKVFEPKSFKKVNGQWELQEMEIRNVQTGSSTRLEFDLKK